MPDKPGVWWARYTGSIKGMAHDYPVMVRWDSLFGNLLMGFCPIAEEWIEISYFEHFIWLGPVLSFDQADELQRHAAALEAQVEDLENEVIGALEFEQNGDEENDAYYYYLLDAMCDGEPRDTPPQSVREWMAFHDRQPRKPTKEG